MLVPSGIREVFDRATELEAAGRSIIHLEIGRPHLASPAAAVEAARQALAAGAVHYTDNRGTIELRAAVAADLRARGSSYDPKTEIVVTAGGSEAVIAALHTLLEAGDEAIVCEPAWPHYVAQIKLAGGRPVQVGCAPADGFQPDPDAIARAIGPRTRVLVVSSPSNPTGAVVDRERLEALASLCQRHDLVAVSDEIYRAFTFAHAEHVSIATLDGMRERTVITDSCSKTWSMTGWRVGWAAGPAPLAARLNIVHQYLTVCAPTFSQAGATAALTNATEFVTGLVAQYAARRQEVLDALETHPWLELDVAPRGAFYVFPRVLDRDRDGTEVARTLLERAGVAVVPGGVFGASYRDHVRISYAVEAEILREALQRLAGR